MRLKLFIKGQEDIDPNQSSLVTRIYNKYSTYT